MLKLPTKKDDIRLEEALLALNQQDFEILSIIQQEKKVDIEYLLEFTRIPKEYLESSLYRLYRNGKLNYQINNNGGKYTLW